MRDRATTLVAALGAALAVVACSGGQERNVVNQYFTALKANDTNTLTSFAMVQFAQPVDNWKIVSVGPETRTAAPLPELVNKQKDLEAQLSKNTRDARAWGNDLNVYSKLDQVRAAEAKGAKVPPALAPIQEKWDAFQTTDRELKKSVDLAKTAVNRERHNVALSVGQVEDVEKLNGEMVTKDLELQLTSQGETKAYVMTLRKYELKGGSEPRMISRWVVQSLTPKA